MTKRRVFITGSGAVASTGLSIDPIWSALSTGQTGISALENHDLSTWRAHLGGEIKNYRPATMIPDKKLIKLMSRQDVLGLSAAVQAVEESGCIAYRNGLSSQTDFNESTALYVASPGNKYAQQYDFLPLIAQSNNMQAFADGLFNTVHPMWLLRILPNNVLAYTGIIFGFQGENHNIVNHAVSGLQAILEAHSAIERGLAERAVVVAYDDGIEPQALFYYDRLGVLSATGLRPFDKAHDGTILAEGAAALVLESEASIEARGAIPKAEIIGGFSETEGQGLFTIDASGQPLSQLLQKTLTHYQLSPSQIDYLVAHGNGSELSDQTEAKAIVEVFGENSIPVTAYKWSMGHTLCASGVMDAVLTLEDMKHQHISGIAPFTQLSDACSGLNIVQSARKMSSKAHMLLINRGFASMNAALVLKQI